MATGGGPHSLTSSKRESLTCSLCLDIFKTPKLLSCSHTFCQKCLEDLIAHQTETFHCPACRKAIQVPPQGAAAFQANFYLDEEELDQARNDSLCSVHSSKTLEMFCVECDELLCMDCKMKDHFHHKTQNLLDAQRNAEDQLLHDKIRLRKVKDNLEEKIAQHRSNLEEFTKKKTAVEARIRHRHAVLVAEADQYLKEALNSIKDSCSEIEQTHVTDLETGQNNLREVVTLEQKIESAIEQGEGCRIVNMATEMRIGHGRQENLDKLQMAPLHQVSRPVHIMDNRDDNAMFDGMKKFIGSAQQVTYDNACPKVAVEEQYKCNDDADSMIFCVCPLDDDTVQLSFQPSYKDKEPSGKKLLIESKQILTLKSKGSRSLRCRPEGRLIAYSQTMYQRRTFVKNGDPVNVSGHHSLHSCTDSDQASVIIVSVVTNDPFKTIDSKQCSFRCGYHRAVDINSTSQLFAVVEEPKSAESYRQVKLFHRWATTAKDTYVSPVTPCQPADVCFFTMDSQEVLLIADEMNDAIHVVNVDNDRLKFSRFLAPGCPLLLSPMALNRDTRGRLWVGCMGCKILTVEPV